MARRRNRTMLQLLLAALTTAVLAVGGAALPAGAAVSPNAQGTGPYYLALGDSVAFGYAPPAVTPPVKYTNPRNFHGYPEYLAPWVGLNEINASCPGETTSSFLDVSAQSNGCENSIGSDTGYRDLFPLHTPYAKTQLDFASRFLTVHPDTDLVTINLGANDIFVCQSTTSDQCRGTDFQATLATIAANMKTILSTVRATYSGRLVLLDYYSIDYRDPVQVGGTQFLNNTLNTVAASYDVTIANGYSAFKKAAGRSGSPCKAGLLIKLPDGTCNIHPSEYGHLVLAGAIAAAINAPTQSLGKN